MKNVYLNVKKAYEEYNLNSQHRVNEYTFLQIGKLLEENKESINLVLELNGRKIRYEDLEKKYNELKEASFDYNSQINMTKGNNNFVNFVTSLSSGIITVEVEDTLYTFECMLQAVKNRVGLVITTMEYNELDDKNFLLSMVQKALEQYNIDENLIQIMPYEEWDEKYSDIVVYSYLKNEVKRKEKVETRYIYIADESFRADALKEYDRLQKEGKKVELIQEKNINNAIEKINENRTIGSVIYTQNPKDAYRFINLVHSDNVFVNTSLENEKEVVQSNNIMLENKNIIYELKSIV